MFSAAPTPNSIKPDFQSEFEIFSSNVTAIAQAFEQGNLSREALNQLMSTLRSVSTATGDFEQPNPVSDFIESQQQADDSQNRVTESMLYDVVLDDWFNCQSEYLMINGRLPTDGHDPKVDMLDYIGLLSQAMKLAGLEKIGPDNEALWQEFIMTKNPSMVIGRDAAPFVKVGNAYSLVSPKFLAFCAVNKSYRDELKNSYHF